MNNEKDIERFDAIERKDFSMGGKEDQQLLRSISELDEIMHEQNTEVVSSTFAEKLLAEALKVKSTPSVGRLLKILILTFMPILIISLVVMFLSTGTAENPALITTTLEKFYQVVQFATDPKVQQLFLIGEGIILLVIVEKIVSSYRIFRHSSHN